MNHLTGEQLDQLLDAQDLSESPHIAACQYCRDRLAERKAIAARLRTAFATITAPEGLGETIQEQLRLASVPSRQTRPSGFSLKQHWRSLAAAAVFLLVALPFYYFVSSPTPVQAAQAELVKIHHHNLSPHSEFFTDDDPKNLAAYFKEQLGFTPEFPTLGQGMDIRGCCVTHFRKQPVGSYVVNTPHGFISIIVVTDKPKDDLGMTEFSTTQPRTQWISTFDICNMAAVRLNNYTYCAVATGEVSHETLIELLDLLLPSKVTKAMRP